MANSMLSISRRLHLSLLSNPRFFQISMPFCTTNISSRDDAESDDPVLNSDTDPLPESTLQSPSSASTTSQGSSEERMIYDRPLENGLDAGIYKAILVGQVGQAPLQKKLKGGREVTLLSLGTGGIRNNRRPLQNEDPREYANRCAVQWHRVSIYPERLAKIALKHVVPGSIIYVEGNLETKIFTDPLTGLVRRIREVAIRRNGRLVFLGGGGQDQETSRSDLRGVGYY